ncbi:MAG: hypothetical protein ACKOSQ_10220 [Planctomycetaceae bacterium]
MRELAAHADAGGRVSAAPGWDVPRGMAFAGCAVAALAAGAALVAEPLGAVIVGRPPPPQAIRDGVAVAPIAAVHAAYTQATQAGLNRPPSAEEVRLQQFSRLARSLARTLWWLAAAGGLVAAAGFALRSARGPAGNDGS